MVQSFTINLAVGGEPTALAGEIPGRRLLPTGPKQTRKLAHLVVQFRGDPHSLRRCPYVRG